MIWLGEDEESSGLHRLITTASTVLYHYCYSYFCDEVRLGFFLRSPWKNPANLLLFFVTSDQKRVTVWSPVFVFPWSPWLRKRRRSERQSVASTTKNQNKSKDLVLSSRTHDKRSRERHHGRWKAIQWSTKAIRVFSGLTNIKMTVIDLFSLKTFDLQKLACKWTVSRVWEGNKKQRHHIQRLLGCVEDSNSF